jgi:RNA polymerase sigma-70 factor (ECF subfamily)
MGLSPSLARERLPQNVVRWKFGVQQCDLLYYRRRTTIFRATHGQDLMMTDSTQQSPFKDTEELAKFIESRRAPLLGYIQNNLGPALRRKLEPEDILQEVLVTALGAPAQFDVPGRDPFKLLCQIAEQRIIDAHRHLVAAQKRSADREVSIDRPAGSDQAFGFIDLLVASMTSASQAFSRDQRGLRLQAAVLTLPDEQREALRLRYVEGLSTKEVAERLGKSDGAIRVLLSRTLTKLQEVLADP